MRDELTNIKRKLEQRANAQKALAVAKYFKSGKGEYGEGDKFIGVTVPNMRVVAKQYKDLPMKDVVMLLKSPIHEHRYTALLIWVLQYSKGSPAEQERIVNAYLKHLDYINNWDLVDTSAPYILGPYLLNRDRKILFDLVNSNHLWRQRVAIISTYYFIARRNTAQQAARYGRRTRRRGGAASTSNKPAPTPLAYTPRLRRGDRRAVRFIRQGEFDTTLKIAALLLTHPHDLIHKAVGWMLREIGNRDLAAEEKFLKRHCKTMPRTMLRYAIEKFPEPKRQAYLKGKL